MSFKKYVKSRQKFKFFLLLIIIFLIVLTIILLKSDEHKRANIHSLIRVVNDEKQETDGQIIIPEKYNDHEVKARLIKEKIKYLTQQKDTDKEESIRTVLESVTKHVHIFYSAPVAWHKRKVEYNKSEHRLDINDTTTSPKIINIINVAFYPALGLYESTKEIMQRHFEDIKRCGVGVVVLSRNYRLTNDLIVLILNLAPKFNLSVTIEIFFQPNRTAESITNHLNWLEQHSHHPGLYKVLSVSRKAFVPLIYVQNAYNINKDDKFLCNKQGFLRKSAIFIGHIKTKQHAELMRRTCFDGFYSRIPSNSATYASTWKNWSFLKSFAQKYKMLFVPTVGPGFAERGKQPRHGNIQRLRSNGRYYGVAWRTAILNHVGFITISSYNNWREGTQIEESIAKTGFMDYSPGTPDKYLDLTSHWVDNFIKTTEQSQNNCYEFYNNTIC